MATKCNIKFIRQIRLSVDFHICAPLAMLPDTIRWSNDASIFPLLHYHAGRAV